MSKNLNLSESSDLNLKKTKVETKKNGGSGYEEKLSNRRNKSVDINELCLQVK